MFQFSKPHLFYNRPAMGQMVKLIGEVDDDFNGEDNESDGKDSESNAEETHWKGLIAILYILVCANLMYAEVFCVCE